MAQAMTSADVLLANNAEEDIGFILQVLNDFPELAFFPASPIPKTVYRTAKITASPAAAFHSVNAGRTGTKATFGTATVTCLEWAARLAERPPRALAVLKKTLKDAAELPLREALANEQALFHSLVGMPDALRTIQRVQERQDAGSTLHESWGEPRP